jgi:hypothetical protein
MKVQQLVLFAAFAAGCASHPEPAASPPTSVPSGTPDPNSNPDLAPMTPGEPGSPKPETQKPEQGRLELRHFYRLSPGGKTALTVTECDAPACRNPVEVGRALWVAGE